MSELALPPRPQRVSVEVVLISRPCSWRADQFLSSQALQMLLPWIVPLRAEQFMATHHRSGSRAWRELVKLPTHETMHALQHYPFAEPLAPSPEDVTSVSTDPKSSVQLHGFTSSRIEVPALSFEHCMGSALMPRPVTEEPACNHSAVMTRLAIRCASQQALQPPDAAHALGRIPVAACCGVGYSSRLPSTPLREAFAARRPPMLLITLHRC
jgi:hypothetical protein